VFLYIVKNKKEHMTYPYLVGHLNMFEKCLKLFILVARMLETDD